jgi:hypothetical protein
LYIVIRRQTILHALLALLLLLSQQMSFAHLVTHFSDLPRYGSSAGKQLPPQHACEECLAFAQIGSALTDPVFSLPPYTARDVVPVTNLMPGFYPLPIYAFHSRAPPRRLVF